MKILFLLLMTCLFSTFVYSEDVATITFTNKSDTNLDIKTNRLYDTENVQRSQIFANGSVKLQYYAPGPDNIFSFSVPPNSSYNLTLTANHSLIDKGILKYAIQLAEFTITHNNKVCLLRITNFSRFTGTALVQTKTPPALEVPLKAYLGGSGSCSLLESTVEPQDFNTTNKASWWRSIDATSENAFHFTVN